MTLQRAGWSWTSPFTWVDKRGEEHNLSNISPHQVGQLLLRDYRAQLLDAKVKLADGANVGTLTMALARTTLRSKKLTKMEKSMLGKLAGWRMVDTCSQSARRPD